MENDVRDNIGETRVIVEMATSSLVAEHVNKSPQKLEYVCELNLVKSL